MLFDRIRAKVTLNKPIYVGFTVLDVSKLLMFDFHYNAVVKRNGKDARLPFTKTNSRCCHLFTNDVYRNMRDYRDLLVTSSYPPRSFVVFRQQHEG